MGYCGGPTTQAPGQTSDIIEALLTTQIGNAVVAEATVWRPYRGRYLVPYLNGVYYGQNVFAGPSGKARVTVPLLSSDASIFFEDGGLWGSFEDGLDPSYYARKHQEISAARFKIAWTASPKIAPVLGDSQVSAIVATGLARGYNLAVDPLLPTRGSLTYSIHSNGTTKTIRWWRGNKLVAEGSRVGNGALTCTAMNFSGLTIACTLTYSADLAPGVATVEWRWPAQYRLHYALKATNSFTWSEDLTHSPWGTSNTTVTANQADAPNGTHTADLVACGAGALGNVYVINNNNTGFASGTYTMSIYLKGTVGEKVYLFGYANGYGVAATLVTFDGTWQRVSITRTVTGPAELDLLLGTNPNNQTGQSEAALPAVSFYAWGAMLNTGTTPGNYIRTTAAASSTMSFPRTAEDTVNDIGGNDYTYLTPVQASGDYDYAVVPVDDQGQELAAPAVGSDAPVTIKNPPARPTALTATGTAAALTIGWTNGEAGCTYKVYASKINAPVNFGAMTTPAPITTALNATSQVLAAITDYAAADYTTDYNTLAAAFDSAIAALLTAYAAGETGFATAINTLETALIAAIETFRAAIHLNVLQFKANVSSLAAALRLVEVAINSGGASGYTVDTTAALQVGETIIPIISGTGTFAPGSLVTFTGDATSYAVRQFSGVQLVINGGLEIGIAAAASISITQHPLSTGDWQSAMGAAVADAIAAAGAMLQHNPGRYILATYGLPINPPEVDASLLDCVTPFVVPGKIRACVRAVKAGIEEQTNTEIEVEFDNAGAIVTPRPNKASLNAPLTFVSQYVFTVDVGVTDDAAAGVATIIDIYVVAHGTPFDFTTPTVSATLPAILMGYAHVTSPQITVGGAGWYDIAAKARTAAGARSADYDTLTEYIGSDTPDAALTVAAQVQRSRG